MEITIESRTLILKNEIAENAVATAKITPSVLRSLYSLITPKTHNPIKRYQERIPEKNPTIYSITFKTPLKRLHYTKK